MENNVPDKEVVIFLATRLATYMFLIIPIACILVLSASEGLWEPLELKAYDVRARLCSRFNIGHARPTGKVVVVAIVVTYVVVLVVGAVVADDVVIVILFLLLIIF